MIKLNRVKTISVVHRNFTGKNRIKWNLELLKTQREIEKGNVERHDFSQKSARWKVVKDQLLIESNNKCAYCDTPTKVVSFGDVEHFRPKSIYWWLAYCYDNYLLSCTVCNQLFKSDNFPILNLKKRIPHPPVTADMADSKLSEIAPFINPDPVDENKGMMWKNFVTQNKKENAFLLNPYFDDPVKFIGYKADDTIKEVELVVLKKVKHRSEIQKALDEVYGLNRLEIKQLRYYIYLNYFGHREVLRDTGISSSTRIKMKEAIELMKSDSSPYAGMIRYFESQID